MWFRQSRKKRERQRSALLFAERREQRLAVQTRVSAQANIRWRWFGGALAIVVSGLALAALAWVGMQYLERELFWRNDLFRIRDFKIACLGEVITSKHIMDYAELAGCSNLFAINIAEKRDYLLKTVPRVKAVQISRRLPGELVIEVQERVSIARLEMGGYYLTVDREGYVLGSAVGAPHLPVISGHCMPGIRPGTRLAGTTVMNALDVFDVCEGSQFREQFKVVGIDVRNREAVELGLEDGARVNLAWQHMGLRDALSRENLERKLLKLAEILKVAGAQGKRVAQLDMSLENNFPAPEYR